MADTASGMCARSYGEKVVTLNSSMNYLSQKEKTVSMYCDADVIKNGRKTVVVEGKVYDNFDHLMVIGTFTLYKLES